MRVTIYHNPRCSKSREALEILRQNHINPIIIDYLKNPLSLAEIKRLRAHFKLKDFIRYQDPLFQQLHLSLENETEVLEAIVKEPKLMQRPIITFGDKMIMGRPTENIEAFLKHDESRCAKPQTLSIRKAKSD